MHIEEIDKTITQNTNGWEPVSEIFESWLKEKMHYLKPGLTPQPTIKVLIFFALLEAADKACTYDEIRKIFNEKGVIKGNVSDNTLRTSVLSLSKTLDKFNHEFELRSSRGSFRLAKRSQPAISITDEDPTVLLLDPPAFTAEQIAKILVKKGMLPFCALYFLEWSARWWETYSSQEAEIRVGYETNAWEKLDIKQRLYKNAKTTDMLSFVSFAPGEGIAEISLLKKILREDGVKTVHYLAVDSSPRLLRDHIGLLKETLTPEIEEKKLICTGVIADVFSGLGDAIVRIKKRLKEKGVINQESDFLPAASGMLITYLGNCLGNHVPDQETELFSVVHSTFKNRPIEFLVGASVMRSTPDEYKRIWDDFLLQTPRHLLETKKLLISHKNTDEKELPEFTLASNNDANERCPVVIPEAYQARHQIKGQIYRFYYRLAFDLSLVSHLDNEEVPLPKGTLILLYNIIKYDVKTLVEGIEKCGLFKIKYDENYRQIVNTSNGKREYAVFSAYLN